jgi:hypothetical protein
MKMKTISGGIREAFDIKNDEEMEEKREGGERF